MYSKRNEDLTLGADRLPQLLWSRTMTHLPSMRSHTRENHPDSDSNSPRSSNRQDPSINATSHEGKSTDSTPKVSLPIADLSGYPLR